jgi:hypothetical protein
LTPELLISLGGTVFFYSPGESTPRIFPCSDFEVGFKNHIDTFTKEKRKGREAIPGGFFDTDLLLLKGNTPATQSYLELPDSCTSQWLCPS